MNVVIGIGIGVLCGIIPLIFGLVIKHKVLGIVAIVVSGLSGAAFELLEKSPFTAIGVAIIFLVFLFAKYKSKNANHEEDHEEYLNDE